MPTKLYKLDSKGKLRVWLAQAIGDKIVVTHGLDNGQLITETTIATAKNVGRSNATSAEQQAITEVNALYVKKIARDGYKVDLTDETKFVAPMLARDYTKLAHQVPEDIILYFSRKLDGVRCTWDPINKRLMSRKGTEYKIPHIQKALTDCTEPLDGELYFHGYQLNELIAATKKPNTLTPRLEFHVFDVIKDKPFNLRYDDYKRTVIALGSVHIVIVRQIPAKKADIKPMHDQFVQQGYEGVMVRIPEYGYEVGVRSKSLFKYKEFEEEEFLIVDVIEDKEGGAVVGCILDKTAHAVTEILMNTPFDFKVRCRGTDEYRKEQLAARTSLIGKWLTVRYQSIFTDTGVPQFPVGIAIRNDI